MAPLTKVPFIYKYNYTKKTSIFFKKNLQQINLSPFTYNLKFKSNKPTKKTYFANHLTK